MTEQPEASFIEELESDPRAAAELALAHFSLRLEELLGAVFDARASDFSVEQVAEAMGVDSTRIHRLLNGEDPLPAEAFVRYARILGYRALVNVAPVAIGIPELPARFHDWDADVVDEFHQAAGNANGVQTVRWARFHTYTTGVLESLSDIHYVQTTDSATQTVYFDSATEQSVLTIEREDLVEAGQHQVATPTHA